MKNKRDVYYLQYLLLVSVCSWCCCLWSKYM